MGVQKKLINGNQFRDALISASNNINNHRKLVDELNVFPVPDGDTGTNMSMTMSALVSALAILNNPTVGEVASAAASALLRGARGNSGVILSLLFRGIAKILKDHEALDGKTFADALLKGVDSAYKAVMKPTEGTILTVARLSADEALAVANSPEDDPRKILDAVIIKAQEVLEQTPDMLPVLKKAGVVDAGGKGLIVIYEGMQSVFNGQGIIEKAAKDGQPAVSPVRNAAAEFEGEITFTYCTEYIVNKNPGVKAKGALSLRAFLETIGDSVVVVDDDEIIKIHVHTDNPGNAIEEGIKYGALTNMKIDNMRFQHETKIVEAQLSANQSEYVPIDESIEYGFVAVCAGQGLHSLFMDLGANYVVNGGQTMNPSTDDILKAIHTVPAKTVFVLPNNKNIIMAAEQTISLSDRKVIVLQTRSVPQGISAMLAFDPGKNAEENCLAMTKAFEKTGTGLITYAARDSLFDGHNIKEGEILALQEGKLSFIEKDVTKALVRLTRSVVGRNHSFVTIFFGADVLEVDANEAVEAVKEKLGDNIEVTVINGGQPVYYYMISAE